MYFLFLCIAQFYSVQHQSEYTKLSLVLTPLDFEHDPLDHH